MTLEEYQDQWRRAFVEKGHEPVMDEDFGGWDNFVTDAGYHNGPGCRLCGWSTCWHCTGPDKIPECKVKK